MPFYWSVHAISACLMSSCVACTYDSVTLIAFINIQHSLLFGGCGTDRHLRPCCKCVYQTGWGMLCKQPPRTLTNPSQMSFSNQEGRSVSSIPVFWWSSSHRWLDTWSIEPPLRPRGMVANLATPVQVLSRSWWPGPGRRGWKPPRESGRSICAEVNARSWLAGLCSDHDSVAWLFCQHCALTLLMCS